MDKPIESDIALSAEGNHRPPRDWSSALPTIIAVALILLALALVAGVAAGVLHILRPSAQSLGGIAIAAMLLAGVAAAGLCTAAAVLVRMQRELAERVRSVDQNLAGVAQQIFSQSSSAPARPEPNPELLEIRRVLNDMREILLLPDEQRLARFRIVMQAELRRRLLMANQYIDSREFHRAREELSSLAERFGPTDDVRKVNERLVAAMRLALREDIEVATRRISDLMTMARWEHAEQYARELTQKYPDATEPRQLLERVREERKLFDQRHRQRMHDEIQQFVNQRRWREAAGAADMFIQTFPTGVDTDALRQQIETLKANAEIEIRQQLERHIKEYLQRKDYWAALELARRIIAEYPFSPQANVLRMQLPRLEELARQQGPRA